MGRCAKLHRRGTLPKVVLGDADRLLIDEAVRIVDAARAEGIRLRLLGALGIHLHCKGLEDVESRLTRLGEGPSRYTDMDFAAYGKERAGVRSILEDRFGLRSDAQAMLFHGKERLLYAHPTKGYHADVFFDRLSFSHTIELGPPKGGRLDLDFPTLPAADLLLSKLQIHEITDKDVKDVILLLRGHPLTKRDDDAINVDRVVEPLADDWGFWKDATGNLETVRETTSRLQHDGLLSPEAAADVSAKVGSLLAAIEAAPKMRAWRKGERTFAKGRWWNDVEAVVR